MGVFIMIVSSVTTSVLRVKPKSLHTAVILPFRQQKKATALTYKAQSCLKRSPSRKKIWQQDTIHPSGGLARQTANYLLCASMVATCFALERHHIFTATRVKQRYSFARHLALYLLAICFDLNCYKLMRITTRSHKTCSLALALIEDARDERHFDYLISRLEIALCAHNAMTASFEAVARAIHCEAISRENLCFIPQLSQSG